MTETDVYFETFRSNLNEMEEEIQPEVAQAQTPPVAEKNKKLNPLQSTSETADTVDKTKPKEVVLRAGEKKRQAPKIPTKEETEKAAIEEKSPLKLRNLGKIEDKPKRQSPRSGWL